MTQSKTLDEIVRASTLLSVQKSLKSLISIFVDQAMDVSRSSLAAFYLFSEPDAKKSDLLLAYRRGRYEIPQRLESEMESVQFLEECPEALVRLDRTPGWFEEIFLNEAMQSAIALPVRTRTKKIGILILNSRKNQFYNRERFLFLDSFSNLAAGMLENAQLLKELNDYTRQVEALQRYQDNIFSSMTNLLLTTDHNGNLAYYNMAAKERFGLSEENLNKPLKSQFGHTIDKKLLETIESCRTKGLEVLGLEGIYKTDTTEMDFSLNISPLRGKRGRHEGLIYLFTDQSKEKELKEKMNVAVEDRRKIKNMFSTYLSKEVVQHLVETPELVKPGGGQKNATIFFADIRGYTSFSEGKDPEYIIEVLNEYFSEAVELVIKNDGYIDKFIGDCIMAAWGVPIEDQGVDALKAVTCAMEIQKMVRSESRSFFRDRAKDLQIGIGMHTGPLVAGNLGSSRRMDYTVIGDTVNLASRLEGVAGAGEVIITEDTKSHLGDQFIFEKREPVKVKGKVKPIQIYNVIDIAG